jgi:hypothetical protein
MAWHHLLCEGFSLHQDMIAHQQKKVAEEQESRVSEEKKLYKMKQISTNNVHHINSVLKQHRQYKWFSAKIFADY